MKRRQKGFTMVELIVVVVIIGILAVAIAPQVVKYVAKAKFVAVQENVMMIDRSFEYVMAETQMDFSKIETGARIPWTYGRPEDSTAAQKEFSDMLEETVGDELKGKYLVYVYPTDSRAGEDSGKHIIFYSEDKIEPNEPCYRYYNGKITKGTINNPGNEIKI